MRGEISSEGVHDPEAKRIFHPAGWYNPLPTLSPQEDPLPPPEMNYTVEDLQPFTVYEFQVLSENSQGKAASEWVSGATLEAGQSRQVSINGRLEQYVVAGDSTNDAVLV